MQIVTHCDHSIQSSLAKTDGMCVFGMASLTQMQLSERTKYNFKQPAQEIDSCSLFTYSLFHCMCSIFEHAVLPQVGHLHLLWGVAIPCHFVHPLFGA